MNTPIVKFEDLIAWQKARDLAVEVYRIFMAIRDFDFRINLLITYNLPLILSPTTYHV